MKTKLKLKLKMRRDDRRKAHNYCGISSDPIAAVSTLYCRRGISYMEQDRNKIILEFLRKRCLLGKILNSCSSFNKNSVENTFIKHCLQCIYQSNFSVLKFSLHFLWFGFVMLPDIRQSVAPWFATTFSLGFCSLFLLFFIKQLHIQYI